jgi:hypothetical protein
LERLTGVAAAAAADDDDDDDDDDYLWCLNLLTSTSTPLREFSHQAYLFQNNSSSLILALLLLFFAYFSKFRYLPSHLSGFTICSGMQYFI